MTLRELRERANLTQSDVAQSGLGVTQSAISQWEIGKTFLNMKRISILAKLYGASEQEVFVAITNQIENCKKQTAS